MTQFSWLHLSDLHFGQPGQGVVWPAFKQVFFKDLEEVHKRTGPWDVVLFSGDLVQNGGAEQFRNLDEDVLDPLWKKMEELGSTPRLLAVPGNHDLTRPRRSNPIPPDLRLLLKEGGFHDIADEFFGDPDSPYRRIITNSFENYTTWWNVCKQRPEKIREGLLPGEFSVGIPTRDGKLTVGVVCLNSTFLQLEGGDYTGRLVLDPRQTNHACGGDGPEWRKQHHLCLLMTHQGPDWLDRHYRHDYPTINAAGDYAVHLFGHTHENKSEHHSSGGGEVVRKWQGHSLFSMEDVKWPKPIDRRHGYAAGKVTFDPDFGTAQLRVWPREAKNLGGNGWQFRRDGGFVLNEEDGGTKPELLELGRHIRLKSAMARQNVATSSGLPVSSNPLDGERSIQIITSTAAATVVVLTALSLEAKAVVSRLTENEKRNVEGTWVESGRFGDWRIIVAEVGAGNSSVAVEATRLLGHYKPEMVAFIGVAGGIKDCGIGDIVVATKVYGYESGKETEVGHLPRPNVHQSSHESVSKARLVGRTDGWHQHLKANLWASQKKPAVFVAPIASGEAVVAAREGRIATLLRQSYSDALAVAMEDLGFLQAAHAHRNVQSLVVRGISDLLSNKAQAESRNSQPMAADAAAAFFFAFLSLKEGPVVESPAQLDQGLVDPASGQGLTGSGPVGHRTSTKAGFPQSLTLQAPADDLNNLLAHAFPAQYKALYGRDDIVAECSALLSSPSNPRSPNLGLIITAIGGMGKTALAHEICLSDAVRNTFDLVLGTHASRMNIRAPNRSNYAPPMTETQDGVSTLTQFLSAVARQLNISSNSFELNKTDAQKEEAILERITNHRVLFVLDNLETMPETSYIVSALQRMCKIPKHMMLLTSRTYGGEYQGLNFRVLGPISEREACVNLVESKLLDGDGRPGTYRGPAIDSIFEIAKGHPLALELLAGKLNTQDPPAIELLSQQWTAKPSSAVGDDYIKSLFEFVFDKSFKSYIGPDGMRLLRIVAERPETNESLARRAAAMKAAKMKWQWSENDFNKALGKLVEANCITRERTKNITWLTMHPLTRAFIGSDPFNGTRE